MSIPRALNADFNFEAYFARLEENPNAATQEKIDRRREIEETFCLEVNIYFIYRISIEINLLIMTDQKIEEDSQGEYEDEAVGRSSTGQSVPGSKYICMTCG